MGSSDAMDELRLTDERSCRRLGLYTGIITAAYELSRPDGLASSVDDCPQSDLLRFCEVRIEGYVGGTIRITIDPKASR